LWPSPRRPLAATAQRRIEAELRGWRATLVHAATPFGVGLAGRTAAQTLGLPLVTSYHPDAAGTAALARLGAPGWKYLRWFHNGARRTFCPTHEQSAELAARGVPRAAPWTRGVDAGRFHPRHRSALVRARLGADESTVIVAAVLGPVRPRQQIERLLAVARRVQADSARRVIFAVAGVAAPRAATTQGATADLVFAGEPAGAALGSFYASADLLVVPSATDADGDVLLEAMASGLPVLAVDAHVTREFLGDGRGVIVGPHNELGLASRIVSLADAPDERAAFAAQALDHARQRTTGAAADAMLGEYTAVREEHRAHTLLRFLPARREPLQPRERTHATA